MKLSRRLVVTINSRRRPAPWGAAINGSRAAAFLSSSTTTSTTSSSGNAANELALLAAAAAAVAVAVVTTGLCLYDDDDDSRRVNEPERRQQKFSISKSTVVSPLSFPIVLATRKKTRLDDEESSPSFYSGIFPFSRSRLRGYKTVNRLEQTSARGETLESKYIVDLKNPLGQGAFGAVYVGTNRKTNEKVAVKKISKRYTDSEAFQRETDALLHIRECGGHPNICGLRENYNTRDHFFLVLDLVSGGEMFDNLCNQGEGYSEADAAHMVRDIASALAFMHGIGIVQYVCFCSYCCFFDMPTT
jgi:Protein kinase domain